MVFTTQNTRPKWMCQDVGLGLCLGLCLGLYEISLTCGYFLRSILFWQPFEELISWVAGYLRMILRLPLCMGKCFRNCKNHGYQILSKNSINIILDKCSSFLLPGASGPSHSVMVVDGLLKMGAKWMFQY